MGFKQPQLYRVITGQNDGPQGISVDKEGIEMKGMEISKEFFLEWGYPFLQKNCPEIIDRIAAGRLGGGSDVIGVDDEISRDHSWGPFFQIFLSDEDYAA